MTVESTWRFLLVARQAATLGLWHAIPRVGELPFLKGFSLWTNQSERVYFYWPPGPNPVVTISTRVGPGSRLVRSPLVAPRCHGNTCIFFPFAEKDYSARFRLWFFSIYSQHSNVSTEAPCCNLAKSSKSRGRKRIPRGCSTTFEGIDDWLGPAKKSSQNLILKLLGMLAISQFKARFQAGKQV